MSFFLPNTTFATHKRTKELNKWWICKECNLIRFTKTCNICTTKNNTKIKKIKMNDVQEAKEQRHKELTQMKLNAQYNACIIDHIRRVTLIKIQLGVRI